MKIQPNKLYNIWCGPKLSYEFDFSGVFKRYNKVRIIQEDVPLQIARRMVEGNRHDTLSKYWIEDQKGNRIK